MEYNRRTYTKEEHQIDRKDIDPHAIRVIEKLHENGYAAYLVGGGVRDLLLNKKPKDFDISTSAEPHEIKRLFSRCFIVGRRFRLAHVVFGKKVIEVSTFRSGDQEDEALIVRDNCWGSEEEDVVRRDFTMNGLYYDAETEEVIDYVGGYQDVQDQHMRVIGNPMRRFKQDPVRIIRLIKFYARFGFSLDEQMIEAVLDCKEEILKASQARVFEEILRMLESGASAPFFKAMIRFGIIEVIFPNLSSLFSQPCGQQVLRMLEEIDQVPQKYLERPYVRDFLLGAMMYFVVEHDISAKLKMHALSFSQLGGEISDSLAFRFSPFFQLPKKMFLSIKFLLLSQWVFIPGSITGKKRVRLQTKRMHQFALGILKLRATIDPTLQEAVERWLNKVE